MLKQTVRKLLPTFAMDCYHRALALAGAVFYGFPSRRLKVIGITGTKGKTSTAYFITKILEHAGYKVGVVSGLHFKIGAIEEPNTRKMTMPGRFFIQRQLRRMADAGCAYAVLEVTSEGIAQHRHAWIDFDTVVLTNIAREHLEAHGGFEKYIAVKQELFRGLNGATRIKQLKGSSSPFTSNRSTRIQKTIIVNGDDARADDFISFPADRKYCCHLGDHKNEDELSVCTDIIGEHPEVSDHRTSFTVSQTPFVLRVPGLFNASNALLAIAACSAEGLSLHDMAEALGAITHIPGRMEYINAGQSFDVVVDYAHTPESLEAIYGTLRGLLDTKDRQGRLIAVLGATGGGRDTWKRPVLGAVAGMWCDEVVVTNEDPYDEDPGRIIEDVANGVLNARSFYRGHFGEPAYTERAEHMLPAPQKIRDRRFAIQKVLSQARPGDAVVISGKGSESVMAVKEGAKIPWDDRIVVKEELAKLART